MKSVYSAFKEHITNYMKKEFLKEGVKDLDFLTKKNKTIEEEVKININSNRKLYEEKMIIYKPIKTSINEKSNNLFCTQKSKFSNIMKKQSYFYSNITGMDKEIDITCDYIFKGIFSDEARTINFLESILIGNNKIFPINTKINELNYIRNEYIQNKNPDNAKKIIFDIQLKTDFGIFIIEMQKYPSKDYLKRIEFYNSLAYSNQDIKGKGFIKIEDNTIKNYMKDYQFAKPLVTISIIKGRLFDNDVPCISYHTNKEEETNRKYMNAFSYVFIELDKFDGNNKLMTDNEKDWITFLKTQDLYKNYKNEQVVSAINYVNNIKKNNYLEYVRHLMSELVEIKELESAEEKGEKIGIEKIAKKMIIKQIPIEEIIELTSLTKEEINNLK